MILISLIQHSESGLRVGFTVRGAGHRAPDDGRATVTMTVTPVRPGAAAATGTASDAGPGQPPGPRSPLLARGS